MFSFKEEHLMRLLEINSFPVLADPMVFFGLRGCTPIDADNYSFSEAHPLQVQIPNYLNPLCTLGQWKPGQGIAVFPGSTVPHQSYVAQAKHRNGSGANQLMTGFFADYRKGMHNPGSLSGHQAFRQANKLPIRRTADDLDYDNDDRVEYMAPFDNLHCAWSMGLSDKYSSAGCQVVVGYPKSKRRDNFPDTGAWKVFRENAYALSQNSFSYLLLNGRDAQNAALNVNRPILKRLRYGSQGDLVRELQGKLKSRRYYEGKVDGDFGGRTLMAVLNFQEACFGKGEGDGIIGPNTSSALDLSLPASPGKVDGVLVAVHN